MRKLAIIILVIGLLPFLTVNSEAVDATFGTIDPTFAAGISSMYNVSDFTFPYYVETNYTDPLNAEVTQFRLAVWGWVEWWNPVGDLEMVLWINGQNMSYPDYTGTTSGSGPYYGFVGWNVSKAVTTYALFEIKIINGTLDEWYLYANGDINGDGHLSLYEHNNDTNGLNGILDVDAQFHDVVCEFTVTGYTATPTPTPVEYIERSWGESGWGPLEAPTARKLYGSGAGWLEHGCYIPFVGKNGVDHKLKKVELGVRSLAPIGHHNFENTPSDLLAFDLWVNNIYVGHPDNVDWTNFIEGGYWDAKGILEWNNLNLTINSSLGVVFELKANPQSSWYTKIFYYRMGREGVDLDQDGALNIKENSLFSGHNGLVDVPLTYDNRDPAFKFYMDCPSEGGGDLETLGTHGLIDITGSLKRYQPVYIHYSVPSLADPVYLYVAHGGNVTDQGSPYLIPVYYGTWVYVPQDTGLYYFNISGYASATRTIVANTDTDRIQALPSIGTFINPIQLNFVYTKATDGLIGVFKAHEDINDIDNAIDRIAISSTVHNVSYTPRNTQYTERKVYFRLFANTTTPEPVSDVAVFVIYGVDEIRLDVQYNPLLLPQNEIFYYRHNFVNARVGVFVDNTTKIEDIGEYKAGTFSYPFETGGFKWIEMKVFLNNTWIALPGSAFSLNVSGEPPVIPADTDVWGEIDIAGWLGPMWSAVLGLAIMVGLLLVPAILDTKYRMTLKVPTMAYIILAGIGISIAVVLNLFPVWVIVFLISAMVFAAVFLYVYKTGSSTEG